jgi:hypothetical protein
MGVFLIGGAMFFVGLAQLAALLIYVLLKVVVLLIQEAIRNSQKNAARADRARVAQRYAAVQSFSPAPMMRDLPMLKGRHRPRVAVERRVKRRWFGR